MNYLKEHKNGVYIVIIIVIGFALAFGGYKGNAYIESLKILKQESDEKVAVAEKQLEVINKEIVLVTKERDSYKEQSLKLAGSYERLYKLIKEKAESINNIKPPKDVQEAVKILEGMGYEVVKK